MTEEKSTSVYVHIPFCKRICIYCDFSVTTARKHFNSFSEALIREITLRAQKDLKLPAETVYFGGGTPSFLPIPLFAKVIETFVRSGVLQPKSLTEVTLEANPSETSFAALQRFRELGVTRLSLGVQSFNDQDLNFLTRTHSAGDALRTFEDARQAGFENISIDLMFGTPGQTMSSWKKTVALALSLEPEHISTYSLTFEQGTPLDKMRKKGKVAPAEDEAYLAMYLFLCERLTENGYDHYEISNFSRPGFQSKHNQRYWSGKPYTGFGPSAHSLEYREGRRVRKANVPELKNYLRMIGEGDLPVAEAEVLHPQQEMIEDLFLGLRTREGIQTRAFNEKYEVDLDRALSRLSEPLARLTANESGWISLSNEGMFMCDELCSELLRWLD